MNPSSNETLSFNTEIEEETQQPEALMEPSLIPVLNES